ncbi:MAG: TIGR00730 family Rossman fold protein [Clostridia bacterium]|nr:TIGR00730 family Rossman fold protein [Clostridia bacterium]
MEKYICVYSSSSTVIDKVYFEVARKLGVEMARKKYGLIFGGGMVGLMGETAKGIHQESGKVIGVIPEVLNKPGIVYSLCDELVVTETLRERKAIMDERSAGFIALPGGFGTLEELLEIITLKQLQYHNKPIVILNIQGFYDGLIEVFEKIIELKFAKNDCRQLYFVTEDVGEALDYIENYVPQECSSKWENNGE